ncbi:hypothetical protein MQX03_06545 [Chryseobacterium aahli]|uniref:hypothetical protein n=1 Tax=Chryseobacterium aahli TaxID=1278643 RepID=UPI001F60736D|nr:hypothetical protein [Chryseobacterium aahli]MCI3936851.1 hypothetical protein [Chryseobacterium aahli]
MNKLKIRIDSNSFAKHRDNITGIICFDFNGKFFPEKNWNDFIIVLVNNWIESSYRIMSNFTISEDFYFMDGPFSIKIRKNDFGDCSVELIENNVSLLMDFTINIEDAYREILQNLIFLSNYCKQQGWETEDVKKLHYLKDKLSR